MSVHPIEVRNLRFSLNADVPKYWLGGKRSVSIFFDNLSVLFPAGERFFMESVKAFENDIKNPQLREEVRAFYQQEALHSREHVRYNQWLKQNGYPIDEMDASVRSLLSVVAKLPPIIQVGVTCALEHFTALMAQTILGEDDTMAEAHKTMRALWRWHAAEENEHAAVAFDVYEEMAAADPDSTLIGRYPLRAVIMVFAALIFWAKVVEQQVRMMKADGIATDLGEWKALGKFLFNKRGFATRLTRPFLEYFKPDFHPNRLDTTKLLANWKRDFDSLPVYRDSAKRSRLNAA